MYRNFTESRFRTGRAGVLRGAGAHVHSGVHGITPGAPGYRIAGTRNVDMIMEHLVTSGTRTTRSTRITWSTRILK